MKAINVIIPLSCLLLITACGGGNGSSGGDGKPSIPNSAVGFNKTSSFNKLVNSVTAASDGSGDIYIGGDFTTYGNTETNHIVRLNSDGSVDNGFNIGTGFNSRVRSIAIARDGSGDVYVGGDFSIYNGGSVANLVRLNSDGSLDLGFDTGSGFEGAVAIISSIYSIAVVEGNNGDIYAGGTFVAYNGSNYNGIVRLNNDGSADVDFIAGSGFDTGAVNVVRAISLVVDGSNDILVGGRFDSYDGTIGSIGVTANNIARLNSDGTLDAGYLSGVGFNSTVYTITVSNDENGDVYIGGDFSVYNGEQTNQIVLLNNDGSVDATFNSLSGFDRSVRSIAIANDDSGDIYVGGFIGSYNGIATNGLVRLNSDGTIDAGFNVGAGFSKPGITSTVNSILATSNTDVFVGGAFYSYDGIGANYLIKLNEDGSINSSYKTGAGFNFSVWSITEAKDESGDIYVGGAFDSYNGTSIKKIARLNSDGTIDPVFDSKSVFRSSVFSVIPLKDGSGDIYVGGLEKIVRLNSDGTVDAEFSNSSTSVYSISLADDSSGDIYIGGLGFIKRLNSDGTLEQNYVVATDLKRRVLSISKSNDGSGDIYVGGEFANYNGNPAPGILRLNSDGTMDAGFDPGSGFGTSFVNNVAAANDGSGDVYVGGIFTSYKGTDANYIIRLHSDGSVDTNFVIGTGFDNPVWTFTQTKDNSGDIYVGGFFSSYNGVAANRIARLNSNGGLDSGFNVEAGFDEIVRSIMIDKSDNIIVGGNFTRYGSTTVDKILRLDSGGVIK